MGNLSPMTITTATAVHTLTFAASAYLFPVFDNVNKVLTLFSDSAHTVALVVFTNVVQYTPNGYTAS